MRAIFALIMLILTSIVQLFVLYACFFNVSFLLFFILSDLDSVYSPY